jgi:glutathione S-transferase
MNQPILYSFRRCPYAIRARMALNYAQISYEIREVDLRAKPIELLKASPKGTVPVMVMFDQTVLEQSIDIMRWAIVQNDPERWWPPQISIQNELIALIEQNDTQFKFALDHYKYPEHFPHLSQASSNQAMEFLKQLELRLKINNFLFSTQVSIADIAIFPFIRQFAQVDIGYFKSLPYPYLQDWLNYHLESLLFLSAMGKQPLWQSRQPI